eukprot:589875_1
MKCVSLAWPCVSLFICLLSPIINGDNCINATKTIDLHDHKILQITSEFKIQPDSGINPACITTIDLSYNEIVEIEYPGPLWSQLTGLSTLSLAHNNITDHKLSDNFTIMFPNQLTTLDLSHNQITAFSCLDLLVPPRIETLHLDHNHLISFHVRSIGYYRDVQYIDLGHNGITEHMLANNSRIKLPDAIKTLILDGNNIRRFEDIQLPTQLERLILTENPLESVRFMHQNLWNLKSIHLSEEIRNGDALVKQIKRSLVVDLGQIVDVYYGYAQEPVCSIKAKDAHAEESMSRTETKEIVVPMMVVLMMIVMIMMNQIKKHQTQMINPNHEHVSDVTILDECML